MQALAAASMQYCDGDQHATWLQVATNVLLGEAVVGHPARERGHHHLGAADGADQSSGASHHNDSALGGDDHRGPQCSSCSDCCCAASIPSPDQSFALAPARSAAISLVAQLVSGYVPQRLERPPRSTLV